MHLKLFMAKINVFILAAISLTSSKKNKLIKLLKQFYLQLQGNQLLKLFMIKMETLFLIKI